MVTFIATSESVPLFRFLELPENLVHLEHLGHPELLEHPELLVRLGHPVLLVFLDTLS